MLKQKVTAGCSSSSVINPFYVRRMPCAPPLTSFFLFQANEEAGSEKNTSLLSIPHRLFLLILSCLLSPLDFRIIAISEKKLKIPHQPCKKYLDFTQLLQGLYKTNQSVSNPDQGAGGNGKTQTPESHIEMKPVSQVVIPGSFQAQPVRPIKTSRVYTFSFHIFFLYCQVAVQLDFF